MVDELIEDETPQQRLDRLKLRREEILSSLQSIDYALEAEAPVRKSVPNPGIRINGALSYRGVEKCSEYFARLDEDGDGKLSFEDFRAMKSLTKQFGIVHEPEYLDWEAWKMYMNDSGVKTDENGLVDLDGFIHYRRVIESKQLMEVELDKLNLGYLPELQKQWSLLKVLISEVISHRNDAGISIPNQHLDLDDVAFVLGNAGIVFNRHEFLTCMLDRAPFQMTMEDLVRSSFKRHYGNSQEAFASMMEVSTELKRAAKEKEEDHHNHSYSQTSPQKDRDKDKDNEPVVSPWALRLRHLKLIAAPQLISWVFGRRPTPSNHTTYEALIAAKQWAYRWIRKIDFATKRMYDVGTHMHLRMVYRDFRPLETVVTKEEKTFLQYHVSIGTREHAMEDGFGATWALSKVSNAEDFNKKMKMPKECGTVVMIELLLRADTTQAEAKKAADALVIFLRSHFDDELKKNQQYRGIFAFPAESEGDGAAVIRVGLTYKRMVSVDAYLEQMFIPMRLFELVTEVAGEFKVNVPLADLFSSTLINIDTMLSCKFSFRCAIVREAIVSLLHRTRLALSSALSKAEVIPPDDTEELREMNLWIALKKYFPTVVDLCNTGIALLRGVKSNGFTFRYKNLADYVAHLRLDHLWVKKNLPVDAPSLSASVCSLYERWKSTISRDLNNTYQRLKQFLEDRVAKEDARRMKLLMMTRRELEHENAKHQTNELTSKLRDLDIQANESDFVDDESTDVKSMMDDVKEMNCDRDVQALIAYERIHNACLGVHTVDILCGRSRLVFSCHGFDFMDLLPRPPPMLNIKTACDARRKGKT